MGFYEIMLIIRPDIETDQHQEVLGELKTAITKEGGTVSTVLDWRKRRLAYEINKHTEGHYYLVYFSGEGSVIPEIEHYFRVTDTVIRYMVVSIEEQDYQAAVEKAEADAAAAAAQAEKAAAAEAGEPAEEPAEEPASEVDNSADGAEVTAEASDVPAEQAEAVEAEAE